MSDGLFLTIEGIDGSGKSTVVKAIDARFGDVVTSREPSPHWTGPPVREAITSPDTHPMTDFHFFLGDRAHHMKHSIEPALEEDKTFVSDRYVDSTFAYQQEALNGIVDNPLQYIQDSMSEWVLMPDITILIDIPAEVSARRTSDGDKYEASDFLKVVRQNYLELEENNSRIIKVDGTKDQGEVIMECCMIVESAIMSRVEEGM